MSESSSYSVGGNENGRSSGSPPVRAVRYRWSEPVLSPPERSDRPLQKRWHVPQGECYTPPLGTTKERGIAEDQIGSSAGHAGPDGPEDAGRHGATTRLWDCPAHRTDQRRVAAPE